MFSNPFKKDTTPDPGPAGGPPQTDAQSEAGLSADAIQGWREKILAAGSDDAALLQLAREAPATDLKLAALQALTQEDSFRQAMHEFRERDKRLYRAAKTRWEEARTKRSAIAEANALITAARSLLEQELVPANRVVELDHAWAAVNEWLDAALQAEFAALRGQLGTRMRARGEGERDLARWLIATDDTIDKLRASLAGVAQGGTPPAESEALAAGLLELLASAPDMDDPRRLGKIDEANRALALASSVVERAKFLQSLPVAGSADEAAEKLRIREWRAFPEVSEGDLHTILAYRFADWRNASTQERQLARDAERSHERERSAEQHQRHVSAVERDVEAAEAAHAAGQVAELTRLLARIDQALKRGGVHAALRLRIDSLRREQLRLRDWQRWGGAQRREELAAEAQELAKTAAGKVSIKEHTEAIAKLRERWKELDKLGTASKQAVWLAFDSALKAAYAPVAAHLDKLNAARSENLAARNRIVDGLIQAAAKWFPAEPAAGAAGASIEPAADTAGASIEPAVNAGGAVDAGRAATPTTTAAAPPPDWRAIARTLEDAQTAWRKLGPVEHTVPRKAQQGENAVTTRYAAAVQALETPLKNSYGEARRQREELIARAKELGGSNVAARDVVDKVRRLQTQWQTVARATPLPRRDDGALWTAFKAATDAIFTARDAGRAAKEAEFTAKIQAREEIIERLTAIPATGSAPDIKRAIAEADTAWRNAPEVPRPQAARLDARYRAARDAATRRLAELTAHAAQARYDALIATMALCREREAVQDSGRALTDEEAADLETRWNAVENLPDAWKAGLEARFRSGKAPVGSLSDTLLNLEVALGIESPAEFLAARQRLKILALKTAMEGRQATVTSPADIERWLLDAAATPRPDEVSRERLAKIIAAVRVRRG